MKAIVILAAVLGIGTQVPLEPGSSVWVAGTSTARDFTCRSTEFTSVVDLTSSTGLEALVEGAVVTIPIAKLDCGNGTMNDHMRKALKSKEQPNIEFKLNSYRLDGAAAVLNGTVTMAGKSKDVEIVGTAVRNGALVNVKGKTQLTMSDWGIKPPSLMLGTMKVRDAVTVGFDVTLKPAL